MKRGSVVRLRRGMTFRDPRTGGIMALPVGERMVIVGARPGDAAADTIMVVQASDRRRVPRRFRVLVEDLEHDDAHR